MGMNLNFCSSWCALLRTRAICYSGSGILQTKFCCAVHFISAIMVHIKCVPSCVGCFVVRALTELFLFLSFSFFAFLWAQCLCVRNRNS